VPEGNDDAVMVNVLGETAMEVDTDLVWAGLPLSFTVAVKLKVPTAVGVPEIPPPVASVSPAGRLPTVIDQV
jgi:hypothetical protein